MAGVAVLVLALAGGWVWYAFAGSKPHLAASLTLADAAPARMQFLGPDKILIVTPAEASLRDLSLKKVLWSASLRAPPADSSNSAGVSAPPIFAGHDKLWICLGDQVKCLDQATGAVKQTVPITGRFVSFTPADTSLLVVSAPDETRRIALRIECPPARFPARKSPSRARKNRPCPTIFRPTSCPPPPC